MERITVDFLSSSVFVDDGGPLTGRHRYDLDTPEAFAAISRAWLRVAWDVKHQWTFSWLGRPVIQLPEDLLRLQEAIVDVRPDVIIELGVAHGGTLVFCASICELLRHGRVVGVELPRSPDLDHRAAIEAHELADYITLIHGDSIDPEVVANVYSHVDDGDVVLLLLDSDHHRAHVLAELEHYGPLVTPGSYAIVQDGYVMQLVAEHRGPRSEPGWAIDNPLVAVADFAAAHDDFVVDPPTPSFDESVGLLPGVTHWTGGWLRRVGSDGGGAVGHARAGAAAARS